MEKYITNPEGLRAKVAKYGVAIIPGVLNNDECEQMKNDMWDTLEIITSKFDTPIDRNDQSSWKSLYDLFPLHSMLIQHHSIGHSSLAWNVRKNKKVRKVFETLYDGDEELLTSFDGVSIAMPPEITNRGYYRGTNWLHNDQSYTRKEFETLQSWVTAYNVNEGDATLTFLEKSHLVHPTIDDNNRDDWNVLKDPERMKLYAHCKQKCITCKAGDMVFWDSRTIHAGKEAVKGRAAPNFRCVVYVCMLPRSIATPAQLAKKQKAFNEMRTTNHHPVRVKLFAKTPRTYGKELKPITQLPMPILTRSEKQLAGF
jgi:hypothetical protein